MRTALAAIAASAVAGSGLAQDSAPLRPLGPKHFVSVRPPSSPSIPDKALRRQVEGEAVIRCAVAAKGRLADCVIEAEAPTGYGFGKSALRLVKTGKLPQQTADGTATAGLPFRATVLFRIGRVQSSAKGVGLGGCERAEDAKFGDDPPIVICGSAAPSL